MTSELVEIVQNGEIDLLIIGWLDENSGSEKTRKAYEDNIHLLREALQGVGLDLDSPVQEVRFVVQACAKSSKVLGRVVSQATQNQRLSSWSSFFEYADLPNPVKKVKRGKPDEYSSSKALSQEEVRDGLAKIDVSTSDGKMVLAFLLILLGTGHRVTAVRSLKLSEMKGRDILFHEKGGKQRWESLPSRAYNAVQEWLAVGNLDGDMLFPFGEKTGYNTVRRVFNTHPHALRHTFALWHYLKYNDIVALCEALMHESLETTTRYVKSLLIERKYGDELLSDILD
jgi:integrase/recombinase XerD